MVESADVPSAGDDGALDRAEVVRRVAALRAAGESLPVFGRRIGVSSETIAQWNKGRAGPSLANLVGISRATGLSVHWLATGEGPQHVDPDQVADWLVSTGLWRWMGEHERALVRSGSSGLPALLESGLNLARLEEQWQFLEHMLQRDRRQLSPGSRAQLVARFVDAFVAGTIEGAGGASFVSMQDLISLADELASADARAARRAGGLREDSAPFESGEKPDGER